MVKGTLVNGCCVREWCVRALSGLGSLGFQREQLDNVSNGLYFLKKCCICFYFIDKIKYED